MFICILLHVATVAAAPVPALELVVVFAAVLVVVVVVVVAASALIRSKLFSRKCVCAEYQHAQNAVK